MKNSCPNAAGLATATQPDMDLEAPKMGNIPKITAMHKARISEKCPNSAIMIFGLQQLALVYFLSCLLLPAACNFHHAWPALLRR